MRNFKCYIEDFIYETSSWSIIESAVGSTGELTKPLARYNYVCIREYSALNVFLVEGLPTGLELKAPKKYVSDELRANIGVSNDLRLKRRVVAYGSGEAKEKVVEDDGEEQVDVEHEAEQFVHHLLAPVVGWSEEERHMDERCKEEGGVEASGEGGETLGGKEALGEERSVEKRTIRRTLTDIKIQGG
ncbi:hypothetical protein CAPTEDRAFT_210823 [Capitella teleta]|uniref:Uncharacterized protein n=1 Tax=Capitella teleta TaxID=283909 RepID=R7U9Q8_CAPTE|nr:hypothetical protein CAPTEDRAFT_210823 [Capitella teleta]|eukprot:ELT99840.1 hypothetical protein CAPTEDRAFT_210823 [Capitella teleta]